MALIASFGLATVAVVSTVDVQQGTNRDHASKEAIAAADAGANVAMLRLNRFVSKLSPTTPCVGPSGETQTPTSGWCPYAPTETAGGATYRYSVSAYSATSGIQVVSTGTAGKVARRVAVSMSPQPGKYVFEGEKLIGEEGIVLKGASPEIETNIGTNGNLDASGASNPKICGNVRVGVGDKESTSVRPTCEGVITEGNKALPPVVPPANIATENWDCRLSNTCSNGEHDTISKSNGMSYNTATRELTVKSQATLTMGGGIYWLCKLSVQSGTIIMAAGAHVQIYIDTPEHCGMSSGAMQVEMAGNSLSSGYNPGEGLYEVPGIYLVGNGGVYLNGSTNGNELTLYAPLSTVELKGNTSWIGMIAGKELRINGSIKFTSDEHIKTPPFTYPPLLLRTRYVECAGTATTPNAGC